jgi:DNA repair protein RadA/Sms
VEFLVPPLNGGFRPGGQYLLAGPPGAVKTTLAVQISCGYARLGREVLFALTEQSVEEARGIFRRISGRHFDEIMRRVRLVSLNAVEELPILLLRQNQESRPALVVVDSLQGNGLPSTATKAYRRISEFQRTAKRLGVTSIAIAHVIKDGGIAGPKSLEHQIDVCIVMRKAGALRQLFVLKNRYGPEWVEPLTLLVGEHGLHPYPHSSSETAVVLGYCGWGDQPLEVQVSATLPKYGSRAELNAPFLPAKRVRQLITTVGSLPGVDLRAMSYAINALVPGGESYSTAIDLPLTVAMLSAYLRQPVPARALLIGGVDLFRRIRAVNPEHLGALSDMLRREDGRIINTVYVAGASAHLLNELLRSAGEGEWDQEVDVIGVRSLDELAPVLWPEIFTTESEADRSPGPEEVRRVSMP